VLMMGDVCEREKERERELMKQRKLTTDICLLFSPPCSIVVFVVVVV